MRVMGHAASRATRWLSSKSTMKPDGHHPGHATSILGAHQGPNEVLYVTLLERLIVGCPLYAPSALLLCQGVTWKTRASEVEVLTSISIPQLDPSLGHENGRYQLKKRMGVNRLVSLCCHRLMVTKAMTGSKNCITGFRVVRVSFLTVPRVLQILSQYHPSGRDVDLEETTLLA